MNKLVKFTIFKSKSTVAAVDLMPFTQIYSCGLHLVRLGLGGFLCQVTSCQVLLTWRTRGILESTRWAWTSPSFRVCCSRQWHLYMAPLPSSKNKLYIPASSSTLRAGPSELFQVHQGSPHLRGLTSSSGSELDPASKDPYSDNPKGSPSFPLPVRWVVTASCVFVFIPSGLPVTSFFFFFSVYRLLCKQLPILSSLSWNTHYSSYLDDWALKRYSVSNSPRKQTYKDGILVYSYCPVKDFASSINLQGLRGEVCFHLVDTAVHIHSLASHWSSFSWSRP